ncbi:FadR/GntR family transcriptional regulator [Arthrobacter sp. M4]|uniref:FadR/GntR family transcriptional regulator n=1 Tax=Arthrobacter sp. M4 TaxID=218160 RepID=UPI001CDCA2FF|nr:FCD domain-containing protein [Arthrobacter sp. M4]MCA4132531.1 FCD domain-containing protein [Arthrobacter sp. M4]
MTAFSSIAETADDDWMEFQAVAELMTCLAGSSIGQGQCIPTLAHLADRLGLGRSTVGSALNSLTRLGILAQRGRGYVLRADSEDLVVCIVRNRVQAGHEAKRQVTSVRIHLLTELAGLAAERRTVEDAARLTQLITEIDAAAGKPITEWDIHSAITRIAREQVLDTVLRRLQALTAHPPGNTAHQQMSVQGYKSALQAIRSGLPQPARDEMIAHLTRVRAPYQSGL